MQRRDRVLLQRERDRLSQEVERSMPDLVLVPTAVVPGDNAQYSNGIAGVDPWRLAMCAISIGATQHYFLADSSDAAKVTGTRDCGP